MGKCGIDDIGYLNERILADGRVAVVMLLTFGRARLSVGQEGSSVFDDEW